MCDTFTRSMVVITLVAGVAEFGLRLSGLQPRLRHCPWHEWPRLLWRTMLDDRIYVMGFFGQATTVRQDEGKTPSQGA